MGVTFFGIGDYESRLEPCLCVQDAPSWGRAYREGVDEASALEFYERASKACRSCHGTGVETVQHDSSTELHLCNANARVLFSALGLPFGEGYGSVGIPEARRALMRARSRDLVRFCRPAEVIHGKPSHDGNVVELRPVRGVASGFGPPDLADRIDRFAAIVKEHERAGKREIRWG